MPHSQGKFLIGILSLVLFLDSSVSSADERKERQGAFYAKLGTHWYPPSPYFDRMESIGVFSRGDMTSTLGELGIFFRVWRRLSIGFSGLYSSKETNITDVDYSGKTKMTDIIWSLPVRYHVIAKGAIFTVGAGPEVLVFDKTFSLSTSVNKDNNGMPTLSGGSSGTSYGLGVLASLDYLLGKSISFFVEDWYHFSFSINGQNVYGDALNPGGNTLSLGLRVWWQ